LPGFRLRLAYHFKVPRLPKNFAIGSVVVEPAPGHRLLSTGGNKAVPSDFKAHVKVVSPAVTVTITMCVQPETGPVVEELCVRAKPAAPVSTSVMRQILVDQLVAAAMREAVMDWPLDAVLAAAVGPREEGRLRVRQQAEADSRTAARIYSAAVAAGNKAPAVAVADAMNRSRSQVARYIRSARELGLLPPLRRGTVTSP
jgi:hypothetical protein